MKLKIRLILLLLFLIISGINSAQSWQTITTTEEVCKVYPEKMEYIFQNLNLDYPGLEKVKTAYQNENLSEACSLLLQYYKSLADKRFTLKPQSKIFEYHKEVADAVLNDTYVFQLVEGKVPRLTNGHLKWNYNGPEDDIEWAWALNRHYPISDILPYYFETKDARYAQYIDSFITDWIVESWPYPAKKSSTAMWRGLEVSFRVKVWSQVFYGLMDSDYLSEATQLLILSSLPDHAHYARQFHAQNNWLTMEISGLVTVATKWPEFQKSKEWQEYAISTMTESLKNQVYPDGAQTELTTHYHRGALNNFYLFYEICKWADISLPEIYQTQLENMWNYLALIMRPDGNALLNNDADLDYNRDRVLKMASNYNREDWKYIASNGESGIIPNNGPSFIFPWAGHLISRNNYSKDAHWSFFDIGPWGSGHQHNDKLHLSVSAYGRDLLVDGGRFAYRGEVAKKFRGFACGTQSHNTILIDGKGQQADVKVVEEPLSENHFKITPNFDYAWNSFDKYNDLENVKHTRSVMYVRDNFWVVVDKVETNKPRKVEALWHWHPDCKVEKLGGNVVASVNERGNLKIIPLGKTNWKVDFVKGQDEPVQGWYSAEYNQYEPNVASIYSTNIEHDETFIWLLVPSEKVAANGQVTIIAQNSDNIKLEVINNKKGTWNLTIPYSNSKNAKLEFTDITSKE